MPMQDVLGLGSDSRMNTPSTLGGNWLWRAKEKAITPKLGGWLAGLSATYFRKESMTK